MENKKQKIIIREMPNKEGKISLFEDIFLMNDDKYEKILSHREMNKEEIDKFFKKYKKNER